MHVRAKIEDMAKKDNNRDALIELIGGPLDGAAVAVDESIVEDGRRDRFVHVFDVSRPDKDGKEWTPATLGECPQLLYRMEDGSKSKAVFVKSIDNHLYME